MFRSGLAGGRAFEVADDALAVFHFQVNDAEAVKRNGSLLGLLRLLGLSRARRVETGLGRPGGGSLPGRRGIVVFHIDVDGRHGDVREEGGVLAIEFDVRFGPQGGINGSAKNAGFGSATHVAFVLLELVELRLAFEVVEKIHAGKFGKVKAGSDFGKMRFFGFAFGVGFLVDEVGFGDGRSGGAVFLELPCGGPIDEGGGKLFPVFALGTVVADAIAFDFILGDGLIGTVLEDEAVGEFLSGRMRREGESKSCQGESGDWEEEGT